MDKVHMGKNKSFASSDSTKLILNQLCPFLWVCVCVYESARNYIIERLNFVIKILCGVRIFA